MTKSDASDSASGSADGACAAVEGSPAQRTPSLVAHDGCAVCGRALRGGAAVLLRPLALPPPRPLPPRPQGPPPLEDACWLCCALWYGLPSSYHLLCLFKLSYVSLSLSIFLCASFISCSHTRNLCSLSLFTPKSLSHSQCSVSTHTHSRSLLFLHTPPLVSTSVLYLSLLHAEEWLPLWLA